MHGIRLCLCSVALGLIAFIGSASAATVSVDSVLDENASSLPNGSCTLREAIEAANGNVAVDGCPAGDPGLDTVVLGAGVHALTLGGTSSSTGDLDVLEDLRLRGDGLESTIVDASGIADRVLEIASGVVVEIEDLTLQGGAIQGPPGQPILGGGIANDGTLTLTRVLVTDNQVRAGVNALFSGFDGNGQGGGIGNRGTLSLFSSSVRGNRAIGGDGDVNCLSLSCYVLDAGLGQGGGVFSSGLAVIFDSSVTGNLAIGGQGIDAFGSIPGFGVGPSGGGDGLGGGVHATGSLDLVRSTVASNQAVGGRGGNGYVESFPGVPGREGGDGFGGGLVTGGETVMKNVTLDANAAVPGAGGSNGGATGIADGGALLVQGGTAAISHATVADHSGGASLVSLAQLTVANSIVVGSCSGTADSSLGGNLESPGNGCGFDLASDQVNVADALLAPLAPNGGITDTRGLLAGSPAIDRGVEANCLPTDQRGTLRPQGVQCDVGAYELAVGGCNGSAAALAFLPPWLLLRRRVRGLARGGTESGSARSIA